MNEYEATVEIKINISAFTKEDASEAILDDLADLPGVTSTVVSIVDIEEIN